MRLPFLSLAQSLVRWFLSSFIRLQFIIIAYDKCSNCSLLMSSLIAFALLYAIVELPGLSVIFEALCVNASSFSSFAIRYQTVSHAIFIVKTSNRSTI